MGFDCEDPGYGSFAISDHAWALLKSADIKAEKCGDMVATNLLSHSVQTLEDGGAGKGVKGIFMSPIMGSNTYGGLVGLASAKPQRAHTARMLAETAMQSLEGSCGGSGALNDAACAVRDLTFIDSFAPHTHPMINVVGSNMSLVALGVIGKLFPRQAERSFL
eukprot:GEMP01085779.1.p1 GENE.GEMP01085779.1~~GEMP01085779.1.p1  ORF type:complete len:163 (+),score=29.09 GEMP01085779.1:338-826(+)